MKLQIDTKEKAIRINDTVNLGELVEILDKILPGEWKTYSLEVDKWMYPTYYFPIQTYPYYPSIPWPYTTSDTNVSVFNVDVQ